MWWDPDELNKLREEQTRQPRQGQERPALRLPLTDLREPPPDRSPRRRDEEDDSDRGIAYIDM